MKIAVVSDCFLPRLGGIEVQVSELARHLAVSGHQPEVFTITPDARAACDDDALPYPVHRMPGRLRLPGGLLVSPGAKEGLRQALVTDRYDVVHVNFGVLSPFAYDAVQLCLELRIPVVVTWHSLIAYAAVPGMRLSGWLDAWNHDGVALTAVSEVAAAGVRRCARGPIGVAVLPNGLDLDTWWIGAKAPAGPRPDGAGIRVVSAMRLAPRKRPSALLSIMRAARALAPEAGLTLELIGDGQLRKRLERSIAEHGDHDWVTLAGRLTRDELRQRYERSDLYISPVKLEAFGIAALEARCWGLPVVGYAASGIAEFVEPGLGGVLVDNDDALAEAIAALARDRVALERMRQHNSTTEPSRFGWESVVAATVAEYARAGANAA